MRAEFWHGICVYLRVMVALHAKPEINLLASEARWGWPEAVRMIFRPRGVNLLVAHSADEFLNIIEHERIYATIVDMDCEESNGLATVKIIRMDYPLVPCILLSSEAGEELLGQALELEIFSVIDKPVDMVLLREQLDRLFLKRYENSIFSL